MEASIHPEPSLGPLALGGVNPLELVQDGRGLATLALMVGTVFDRMTTTDDEKQKAAPDG
jgi:hypothetical protein